MPLLQSYGGYPVVSAKKMGLEDYYNKDGKEVAGMAWGGTKNPPGQGRGEAPLIVPNQNYFKNDPVGYNALVKLEASRHWMNENNYNPKFEITPEIQAWRKKNFENVGVAGQAYLNDDNALRQTIISRKIAGDRNIPNLSGGALSEVKAVNEKLLSAEEASKPTISQSIMSAMGMKLNKDYGSRPDGTSKNTGFLGELKLPDGRIATEYSTQSGAVKVNGKQIDFPTLVPTLSKQDVALMQNDIIPNKKPIPEAIMQKAIEHAKMRLSQKLSPFK